MGTEFVKRVASVDQTSLIYPVKKCLNIDRLEIVDWRYQSISSGFGESYGLYRFRGNAQSFDKTFAWSLILKILGPLSGSAEPSAWNYWKREALVYQSKILEDLPKDVIAPRCYEIVEFPDEETWLWLEDIDSINDDAWSFDRFGLAAYHLGKFNAGYLVEKSLPNEPWLSTSVLRDWLAMAEPGISQLREMSQNPLFEGLVPGNTVERMLRLWAERDRFLTILEKLPRTLCHNDAFRNNLAVRKNSNGQDQTILIDWAMTGIGTLGQDIAPLFGTSLRFVQIDIKRIADLDSMIYSRYLSGLREIGWQGEAQLVRFSYAAISVLKVGIAKPGIRWPQIIKRVEGLPKSSRRPQILGAGREQVVALRCYLLDMGEEALDLIRFLE